eukprot:COSAG02_NODE_10128_length_2014_cov_13.061997_2_plen_103_part_00
MQMHQGNHSAVPLLCDKPQAKPAAAVRSHSAISGLHAEAEQVCAACLPQTQSLCARKDLTFVTGTPSASSRSMCHFLILFSRDDEKRCSPQTTSDVTESVCA